MPMARLAPLLLLCSCGAADQPKTAAPAARETATAPASPAASGAASGVDCEPDAPQSPCPLAGRWRIARVYVPGAADPLVDDRAMIGATLTVAPPGDGPGAIRWDGPDTGQFDIGDVCTGPYLTPRFTPAGSAAARRTLAAALAAWRIPGDAAAARALGCDRGQWGVPTDPAGERFGLVLPLGDRAVIPWYEGRLLLLERRR